MIWTRPILPLQSRAPATGERRRSSGAASGNARAAQEASCCRYDPHLDEEQSAQLRDQLIAEIERMGSGDEAAKWAQGKLGTKNTLMPADASAVESAFAQKLSSLEEGQINPSTAQDDDRPNGSEPREPAGEAPLPCSDDERQPILQKGIRLRDKEHRKFVASKPCPCVRSCAVRSGPSALCPAARPRPPGQRRIYRSALSPPSPRARRGDEAAWWQANKIDPIPFALRLWHERQFDQTSI